MVHPQVAKGAAGIAVKGQHQPFALEIVESHGISQYIFTAKILCRLSGLDFH
jgi:hypothetical protein